MSIAIGVTMSGSAAISSILSRSSTKVGIFGGAAFNFREWRNLGTIHQHAGVEGFGINSVQFINEGGTIRVDGGTLDLSGNIGQGWETIAEFASRDATLIVAPGATLDWHADGYYATAPERNPAGPALGDRRVSRGGAWRHQNPWSPVAHRSSLPPHLRYADYGFRLVRGQ